MTSAREDGTAATQSKVRVEFGYLDSVRGIAAFVVVIWHLLAGFLPYYCAGDSAPTPFIHVLYSGDFAVQVFFVLSGFVLSLSSVRGSSLESLSAAAVRRYIRLAGPVLVSVLLSYLLLVSGCYFNISASQYPGQYPAEWLGRWNNFSPSLFAALDEGLYRSFFWHKQNATYNNVLWTMQIEFAGSLFIYSMMALLGKLRNRGYIYVIIGFLLIRLRLPHMFAFLLGLILCELMFSRRRLDTRSTTGNILGLALILVGYGFAVLHDAHVLNRLPYTSFLFNFTAPLGAFCMLAGVCVSDLLQSILRFRVFLFLGHISFPMYLMHVLIELSLGCWVFLTCMHMGYDRQSALLATAVVTIGGSILLGWLGALTIEPFSIWLGKWVYDTCFKQMDSVRVRNA